MSQRQGFHHNYKELIENVKAIQNEFFNNDEETSQKIKQLIDYQQIIENYDKEEERINKQNEIERAQHQLIFWAKMINDNSKGDELQLRQFFNQLEEIFQLKIQSQNGQDHQVNIELRSEHMEGITISHERDIEQNKEKIQNEKIIDEIDEIIIDEQQ
ncbi:hypothetical protein TTHERM_00672060 (macronuclear) [Tetrahymena thermophila SB210]|uniref:Uncharacterized protein n=1 Tax=Tetrahymena thermophila (strain SB210) TaxID=312017 RepID=Q23E49_TETTS|nr:hypothetical protein TTHERM_00672060 [Tetrahymena thermophila SB210]EAR94738.4 hypothetical protein TTHERM_00672060 [Tetrahymena thermophila SB210]|eukprot:XP_001014983.4 hypothetical protein TTHERM_00672060 [Tetrahymena thermophila SB210]